MKFVFFPTIFFLFMVKPKNKSTLYRITNLPPLQAGFGTQPSMDVSLIVGFTIEVVPNRNAYCFLDAIP